MRARRRYTHDNDTGRDSLHDLGGEGSIPLSSSVLGKPGFYHFANTERKRENCARFLQRRIIFRVAFGN